MITRRAAIASGTAGAALLAMPIAAAQPRSSGCDPGDFDPAVRPGDDFFGHVNGGWMSRTPIPADRPGWNEFARLNDLIVTQVRAIQEQAMQRPASADERRIGDLYASLIDEATIERLGIGPIKPDIDRIDAIATPADLATAIGRLGRDYPRDEFGAVASSAASPITAATYFDVKNPSRYLPTLIQGGLGLPDRAYYLPGNAALAKAGEAYRTYLTRLFTLAGRDRAEERASRVLALETRLAKGQRPRAELFDFDKRYNAWTAAELTAQIPGFEWKALLSAVDYDGIARFLVADPDAFRAVAEAARDVPLADWRDYLVGRALAAFAPMGPKAFAEAHFAFAEQAVKGTPAPKPRWKQASAMIDLAIGPAVGSIYMARHFPPSSRVVVERMAANIKAVMRGRIAALTWMSPATKAEAMRKLAAVRVEIGGETKPRDYRGLAVVRTTAWRNLTNAAAFEYRRKLDRTAHPVDRGEWYMLPHSANGQSDPIMVKTMFCAGLMQPPIYDPAVDSAVNYGALGYFIGHELSHVFDNIGSQFDADGRLRNWWQPADKARFDQATAALAAQYDAYEPLPGVHLNGRQTLHENVADLGGLGLALDAYRLSLGGRAAPTIGGLTGEQRFFMGYARMWREKTREDMARRQATVGTHSPGAFRVATVRNIDAWYAAFDVKPGDRLYLPPDQRVRIW